MAKITVYFGNDVQSERTLDKAELKIGRAVDCDIVVDNLGVSRHHCTIVRENDSWVVVDGGSNNGTFVNGGKIIRHALQNNDRVVLGKHSLVYDAHGQADSTGTGERKASAGMGGEMTMFVDQAQLAKMARPDSNSRRMAMVLSQGGRDVVVPLVKEETTLGKGPGADLPARGFLVKPIQAKVIKSGPGHRLLALGGMRSVKVNGQKVTDHPLKQGDVITIAGNIMTYRPA
jgi:pSer/pThr/pTyr-binding forkhead associated (FHA) protein